MAAMRRDRTVLVVHRGYHRGPSGPSGPVAVAEAVSAYFFFSSASRVANTSLRTPAADMATGQPP